MYWLAVFHVTEFHIDLTICSFGGAFFFPLHPRFKGEPPNRRCTLVRKKWKIRNLFLHNSWACSINIYSNYTKEVRFCFEFELRQFISIQDGICALGKAHNYAVHPMAVSLRGFPNVAFETVPMFV